MQAAIPPLRTLAPVREQTDPTAKAERAPAREPGDAVVEFAADSVDAQGKRHKATKRVVLSRLQSAVLDNTSLSGSSSALRGRNFALLMAYSSAVAEAKATGRSLAEITQRDVENWRGFEKAAQEGAQRLAIFANAPLEEQLSTLGELGQEGAKALIGELTRLVSGPRRRAEREAALRAQRRSGAINQSEYLQGLRAITRQAAADAILVLEIGVPGSQGFKAARTLKILQRRRGGDGTDDFDDFGGMAPAGAPAGARRAPLGRGPDIEPKGPVRAEMPWDPERGRPSRRGDETSKERLKRLQDAETTAEFRERIGDVPTIRQGAFDTWLDETLDHRKDDAFRLWAEDEELWSKVAQRIRSRKSLHEWYMVSMVPKLLELGVKSEEIRGIGFRSPTGRMMIREKETGRSISHRDGTSGDGEARDLEAFPRAVDAGDRQGEHTGGA